MEHPPALVAVAEQTLDLAVVDRLAVDTGILREPAHRLARGVEDVLDRYVTIRPSGRRRAWGSNLFGIVRG